MPASDQPPPRTPLLPFSAWPRVTPRYIVEQGAGGPRLAIRLTFDPAEIPDNVEPATGDETTDGETATGDDIAAAYDLIHDQLADPRCAMHCASTLAPDTTFPIATGPGTPLIGFVEAIRDSLRRQSPPPAPLTLGFNLADGKLPEQMPNIIAVVVEVTLARTDEAETTVDSVTMRIMPAIASTSSDEEAPQQDSLTRFARLFECAFGGQLKLAVGKEPTDLRAIRLNREDGIHVDAVSGPEGRFSYALPPLSPSLLGGAVEVRDYHPTWSGESGDFTVVERTFSGVDLDLWTDTFLRAFDDFLALAPAVAGLAPDRLEEMVECREQLARSISGRIIPILAPATSPPTPERIARAVDVFHRRLTSALASAYQVDAIAQIPVTVTIPRYDPLSPTVVEIHGAVSIEPPAAGDHPIASFTSGGIRLEPGEQEMTVLCTSSRPAGTSRVTGVIDFAIGSLETDIPRATGDETRPSTRLTLLLTETGDGQPDPQLRLQLPAVSIPIPLRRCPAAPVLQGHAMRQEVADPTRIEDLQRWNYDIVYQPPSASQDAIRLLARYNDIPPGEELAGRQRESTPASLFRALARFTTEYPAIASHIEAITAGDPTIGRAAIDRFADLVRGVADAFDAMDRVPAPLAASDAHYRISEEETGGTISLRRYRHGADSSWPAWPTIEGFVRETENGGATGDELCQEAVYRGASPLVTARKNAEEDHAPITRRISIPGNGMVERATALLRLERNEELIPGSETVESFIYRTPRVGFPAPAMLSIEATSTISLDTLPGATLRAKLGALLHTLLSDEDPTVTRRPDPPERLIDLTVGYRYTLETAEGGGLPITLPCFRVAGYDLADSDRLADELGRNLASWYGEQSPATTDARLVFMVTITTGREGARRPLLSLHELLLTVDPSGAWWNDEK